MVWRLPLIAVLASVGMTAGPAFAQAMQGPDLAVEITSDYRERGLSWSRGAPTILVSGHVPIFDGAGVNATAVGLRDSARGGGADVGLTLGARYAGGQIVRLSGGVDFRLFPGQDGLDYWEVDFGADYDLGPATLGARVHYVPDQSAVGGDNLHISGRGRIALPGTPLALHGGIGWSTGGTDDPLRMTRLRPDGSYADFRLGVDYVHGRYVAGLLYTDTTVRDGVVPQGYTDEHVSSRISMFLRAEF